MSIQDRFDDLHRQMAMEVKSALGENAVVITIISINDRPTGQMVLCDITRHAKSAAANRMRVAADCLSPVPNADPAAYSLPATTLSTEAD